MSVEYVNTEVEKIINDKSFEFPQNLAMAAAWIMGNFKGLNLKVLDTRKRGSLADYFIMGSASNMTQAKSMADTICT
ncbi:MAG: ribosome-associated protein, partial [Bacteriovoracaceae bacterium]